MIDRNKKYRFGSWGLGVQSTFLFVASALGLYGLPKLDAIFTADTQWEREESYKIYDFYKGWYEDRDIPVVRVTAGNIRELGATEHIHIPFFTETGAPLQRQCTSEFKIKPVRRAMRKFMGYHQSKAPHPAPGQIEQWMGISWDEWDRMSTSDVKYINHRYPLIENHINRWDCEAALEALGLPVPIKSACVGCPYRDAANWLEMKTNSPDEFADAVAFDYENRHNPLAERGNSTADQLYVWRGLIPLDQVDWEAEVEKMKVGKQTALFVCTGEVCWT